MLKLVASICCIALLGQLVQTADPSPRAKLSIANDDFSLRLMKSLDNIEHQKLSVESRENVFISPYSVSTVLSMLLAGGAGQTYTQIYDTLGFANSHFTNEELLQALHSLFNDFALHSMKAESAVLSVANSIALQKNYPILQSFMSNISTYFESQVFAEDFTKEAAKATVEINDWVSKATHGKIEKLFSQDLRPDTVMVLLNAIYFKGAWKTRFAPDHTTKADFSLDKDHKVEAQLMNVKSHFYYAHLSDGQLLELPYQDEQLSMYLYLPNNQSSEISAAFTANSDLPEKIGHLRNEIVSVHIPKFRFEHTYHLADVLQKLGARDVFSKANADLSNIDGIKEPKDRVLYLSEVVHKTFIEVNEEGAEAAAATGGIINTHPRPGPPPPQEFDFRADRPFAFFIRDKQNGITLFSGIVNKP